MTLRVRFGGMIAATVFLICGLLAFAQKEKAVEESERKVKASEVSPAALAALKKQAAGATITEFAEEVEHGHKYYEGSWKGPNGPVDCLVTEAGDVVEIEELVPAEKVPSVVRAQLQKEAGKDARVDIERKTLFIYEGHFKKNGKGHEMLFTAEGRQYHEEGEEGAGNDEDEDD